MDQLRENETCQMGSFEIFSDMFGAFFEHRFCINHRIGCSDKKPMRSITSMSKQSTAEENFDEVQDDRISEQQSDDDIGIPEQFHDVECQANFSCDSCMKLNSRLQNAERNLKFWKRRWRLQSWKLRYTKSKEKPTKQTKLREKAYEPEEDEEMDISDNESLYENEDESDTEYIDETEISSEINLQPEKNHREQPKFIAFLSQLLLLFTFCPSCKTDNPLIETRQEKIFPAISLYWNKYQNSLFNMTKLKDRDLVIGGDGRHDSMGHCAKYGAYTVMSYNQQAIIHFELVQIKTFVSDRHATIAKYTRENEKDTKHYFDLWHLKKNFTFSDSTAYKKMKASLTNARLIAGIKKASPLTQTSCIEGFHSVLNHFSPKMIGFSYIGMKCRHIIAVLHFNENLLKEVKKKKDGSVRYAVSYPKFKNGEATVRELRIPSKFGNSLEQEQRNLKQATPAYMNTMLTKECGSSAIQKKLERQNMTIAEVDFKRAQLSSTHGSGFYITLFWSHDPQGQKQEELRLKTLKADPQIL
eukprot:gene4058-biopygen2533